jgi:hypothetical protein
LNVPAVALPSVTVNGAPAAVGVSVVGVIHHVPGTAPVHVNVTLPLYPFTAFNVPFQVTF